jgi:hypothetical protein
LANSFLFSGTKATIVSQWPVKDQVAPLITEKIVKEIVSNKSIGEALRSSLKSLVEDKGNSKFHHPSFWAPFIPISQGVRQNLIKDDSPALQPNWEQVNEEGHLSEAQAVAVSRDHALVISQGFMHSTVNQVTAHGWLDLRDQKNGDGIRIAFPDLASGGDVIVDEQDDLVSTWSTISPADLNKIDTVIIKTDLSGKEVWRKQLGDPARADLPLAMVDLPNGTYVAFISVEDYTNTSHEYWIYLLTFEGEIKDKTKLASFPERTFTPTLGVTAINKNQVLVSWVDKSKGRVFPTSSPITGLSNEILQVAHDSYMTVLGINSGKLNIGEITTIPNTEIEDLTSANGKLFALASKIDEGPDRLGNTVVYEIKNASRQLEVVELFKAGGAAGEFLKTIIVLSGGEFVITGYFSDDKRYEPMEIFEETDSSDSEDLTLDRNAIRDFLLAKEFNPEQVQSAFLSVFDRLGRLIDDYVGVSPTGASFSDAVVIDGKSFVAAGGGGKNGSTVARFTLH